MSRTQKRITDAAYMPAKSTYNNTPCTVNGLEVRLVKNNSGTARKLAASSARMTLIYIPSLEDLVTGNISPLRKIVEWEKTKFYIL